MSEITLLLRAAAAGEDEAFSQLVPLVYGELRRLARSQLRRMGPMTLLDTTGLVHEAYLRLQASTGLDFADRHRFLGYASRLMRAVAVDAARSRGAQKRGGGLVFITLGTEHDGVAGSSDVLRVDEALDELAAFDERLARVVEMRYFGGLSEGEIAACLGVTERTVQRDWRKARLVLLAELAD